MGVKKTGRGVAAPCVMESLETRELFSAATVWASLMPLRTNHRHHAHGVHATPRVGVVPRVKNETGPDILGAWTGTYTYNTFGNKVVEGGVTLTSRHKDAFTGVFDTAALGGGANISTVNVAKNRAFNVVVKIGNKQQVSIAGVVQSDLKSIIGRWSFQSAKGWVTGIFRFDRVV
jgi:hypothetical protein